MDENDWQSKIALIEASGLTRKDICDACDIAYSTLSEIANGGSKEPRGIKAVKLHDLYLKVARRGNRAAAA